MSFPMSYNGTCPYCDGRYDPDLESAMVVWNLASNGERLISCEVHNEQYVCHHCGGRWLASRLLPPGVRTPQRVDV